MAKGFHPIPQMGMLLMSGGFDSVTLAHELVKQGVRLHALSFDYGQTHLKELGCARRHCEELKIEHTTVNLHRIKGLFQKSALTDGKGGVIVPNRNSVFCHIAASIAVSAGAESVIIGCNKDDQNDFPDCTWEWLESVNASLEAAKIPVEVCAPYIRLTKRQIAMRAKELGVDRDSVWWCYGGAVEPCGKCMACKKMEDACA